MKVLLDRRSLISTVGLGLLLLLLAWQRGRAAEFPITLSGDNPLLPTQVAPGGTVSFSYSGAVADDDRLQWYFNDALLPGATTSTLVLAGVAPADTGNYRLQILRPAGRIDWSTTLPLNVLAPPASPVDRSFATAFPADVLFATPRFVAPDGRILVSETITGPGTRYARLLADGRPDPTFTFPTAAGIPLAVLADGGFITSQSPFRLDATGAAAPLELPATFDATQPLTAALALPDGRFLLAQGAHLHRFAAAGTIDPTFSTPDSAEGNILWLRRDLTGRLLLNRQRSGGVTAVERRLAAGPLDAAFTLPANLLPWVYYQSFTHCTDIVAQTTGGYLVVYEGTAVVRCREDGSLDQTWGIIGLTTFPGRAFEFRIAATPHGTVLVSTILGRGALWRYITQDGAAIRDPHFYSGSTSGDWSPQFGVDALLLQPDGQLLASGRFTRWDDHVSPLLARLNPDLVSTPPPTATPYVDQSRQTSRRLAAGQTATLGATIEGLGPFTFQWLALDGQTLPANSNSPLVTLPAFSAAQAGRYQLRVTGPGGTVLSAVVTLALDTEPIYLANISGRAVAGRADATMIAGFVTPAAARLLIRGVGPTLRSLGLPHALAAPVLHLGTGAVLDATGNTPAAAALGTQLGAAPLTPDSLDAVGLLDTAAGPATFTLTGLDPSDSAVALAEIYATSPATAPLNLSFRAHTAPGDDTAIAGFVLADPGDTSAPARVLLRAVGPTLTTQGVSTPLADPILTVYDSTGRLVAQNDNWPSHLTADYTPFDAATDRVGAFHLLPDSKDAALLLDLPAGAYTLHATGGTGVVLLEIYLVR